MITTEEIAVRVYQLLQKSQVKNLITGTIDYERSDYSKEDVIIVPLDTSLVVSLLIF